MPTESTPTPGPDERLVLSTDASAVFTVEAMRVGAGETLTLHSPNGAPARVVTGLLEVGDGGRVVADAALELRADRALFGVGAAIVLVGKDGDPGTPGGEGGSRASGDGESGGPGNPGKEGAPGPGGTFHFGELSGTLTVEAGGGRGGQGGRGGRGGLGAAENPHNPPGRSGNGGAGGPGGPGGKGGFVVIAYDTLVPGSAINLVVHAPTAGAAGKGGDGGGGGRGRREGAPGPDGASGAEGEPPSFSIRARA